jgi:hypothetical protein
LRTASSRRRQRPGCASRAEAELDEQRRAASVRGADVLAEMTRLGTALARDADVVDEMIVRHSPRARLARVHGVGKPFGGVVVE